MHESKLKMQTELMKELSEKNTIYDLLKKSNNELKSKIDISSKKYNELVKTLEGKNLSNIEQKLNLQIKEIQKEISANQTETERYKKMIDKLKNKLDFKINLEKSSNFSRILKEETIRNDELKKELNSLTRLNRVQKQYINNYDKDYQITNKINILKKEIQQTKNTIKDYQTKYIKLDKFIKLIHEKIVGIEMIIKKEKLGKDEPKNKKLFTREELKETIDLLNTLKNQVTEKRDHLNTMTKQNDLKVKKILEKNKQILADFKEKEKMNKMLIFKKNELKRNIKNMSVNGMSSNQSNLVKRKYKLNVNNVKNQYININNNNEINNNKMNNNENNDNNENLENELENDAEFHEPENNEMIQNDEQPKLFGKNPNKKIEDNNEDIENLNNGEEAQNENLEQDNDAIENGNINDSNINVDENNNNINNEEFQGES